MTTNAKLGVFVGVLVITIVVGLPLMAFLQDRLDRRHPRPDAAPSAAPLVAAATPAPTPQPSATPSTAVQLATIDCECPAREDETRTRRFAYLLRELTRKTKQSEQEIADVTVNSKEVVRDRFGRDVTLIRLMELGNKSIPDAGTGGAKYQEVMSALIVMTKGELNQ